MLLRAGLSKWSLENISRDHGVEADRSKLLAWDLWDQVETEKGKITGKKQTKKEKNCLLYLPRQTY